MPSPDPFICYLRNPSRESYAQFMLAYAPAVESLVRRVLAKSDGADDVLQETFLRLGRPKQSVAEIREPRSYVLGTAFQLALNHKRKVAVRARHEQRAGRLRAQTGSSACDEASARESLRKLHDAIDALPAPLRVAMHLHVIEGLSYREIGAITKSSPEAVKVRVHRARQRLKALLGAGLVTAVMVHLKELGPLARSAGAAERHWLVKSTAVQEQWRRILGAKRAQPGLPASLVVLGACAGIFSLVLAAGNLARLMFQRVSARSRDWIPATKPWRDGPTQSSRHRQLTRDGRRHCHGACGAAHRPRRLMDPHQRLPVPQTLEMFPIRTKEIST